MEEKLPEYVQISRSGAVRVDVAKFMKSERFKNDMKQLRILRANTTAPAPGQEGGGD